MHKKQQERRNKEEDDIHNAKGKARLQHGAILIRGEMEGGIAADPIVVDSNRKAAAG